MTNGTMSDEHVNPDNDSTERFRQLLWERMFFWSLDNIDHSFTGAVRSAAVALSAFDEQFKDDRR